MLPEGVQGGQYIVRATADDGAKGERPIIVSTYEPPRIKKKLEFVLPATQVDEEFEKRYEEIAKNVPIPGFRVGRAPHSLIEKRYGDEIAKEVTAKLVTATSSTLEGFGRARRMRAETRANEPS